MTTAADTLAEALEAAGIGLTRAVNLFVDILPDTPDLCVALYNNPGVGVTWGLAGNPAANQVRVQIVTRSDPRQPAARTLAQRIHQAASVTDYQPVGLNLPRILAAMSAGPPASIGRDPSGRASFSENLDVTLEEVVLS